MSEAISCPARPAVLRTIQGLALLTAFSGFGACRTEDTNDDSGSRAPQASTDTTQTPESGQSGSEYDPGGAGADRPSCPCGFLKNPLRATVLEVTGHIEGADGRPVRLGNVRLRVNELLGTTTGLEIGSEISANWFGSLPCYYGCASIAVGDEVLAFYRFPRPCINTTGDDCPLGDTIPGRVDLAPWADTKVVLAELVNGDFTVDIEDLPLLETAQCPEQIGYISELLGPNDTERACYERAPAP